MKQMNIRIPDSTYKELEKIAAAANITVSKVARYFIYRELPDFRAKGSGAYEPNFWSNGRAWLRHKDALEEMNNKLYETTKEGREKMFKDALETAKEVDEINKDDDEE